MPKSKGYKTGGTYKVKVTHKKPRVHKHRKGAMKHSHSRPR